MATDKGAGLAGFAILVALGLLLWRGRKAQAAPPGDAKGTMPGTPIGEVVIPSILPYNPTATEQAISANLEEVLKIQDTTIVSQLPTETIITQEGITATVKPVVTSTGETLLGIAAKDPVTGTSIFTTFGYTDPQRATLESSLSRLRSLLEELRAGSLSTIYSASGYKVSDIPYLINVVVAQIVASEAMLAGL